MEAVIDRIWAEAAVTRPRDAAAQVLPLGTHSGSEAVMTAYAGLGVRLTVSEACLLLARIREHATRTRSVPTVTDLQRFYHEAARGPAALA